MRETLEEISVDLTKEKIIQEVFDKGACKQTIFVYRLSEEKTKIVKANEITKCEWMPLVDLNDDNTAYRLKEALKKTSTLPDFYLDEDEEEEDEELADQKRKFTQKFCEHIVANYQKKFFTMEDLKDDYADFKKQYLEESKESPSSDSESESESDDGHIFRHSEGVLYKVVGETYYDPETNEPVYKLEAIPGSKKSAKQIWLNKQLYDKRLEEHQAEKKKKKKKVS
eukprot:SAG11_NODE_5852_length_1447_cov_176.472552_1_plen_226_part_00